MVILPATVDEILDYGTTILKGIIDAQNSVNKSSPQLREIFYRKHQRDLEGYATDLHDKMSLYDAAVVAYIRKLSHTHAATGKDSILIRLNPISIQQETIHTNLRNLNDQIFRRDQELNSRSALCVALISSLVGIAALLVTVQQIYMAMQSDTEIKRITDKFDQRMEIQIGTMKDLNDRLKEQNSLTAKLDSAIEKQLEIVEKQDRLNRAVLAQKPKPSFLMLLDRKKPDPIPEKHAPTEFELKVLLSNAGDRAIEGTIYYHILIPEVLKFSHATGHLSSSSRRSRIVKDERYQEVAGSINAPVFAGQHLGVGEIYLLGPYQSYTLLTSISIKEGQFPAGKGYSAYSMWFAPSGLALTNAAPDVIP
ncbi:MAG: hypothetical protein LZF60_140037 [Nitrospira sp.]|nr:MAG: hypothetical protein LZF60_140037 [Nitrospira sp.]